MKTTKAKLTTILLATFVLLTNLLHAQRGGDDFMDEEDVRDFQRYAHGGLSKFETISIVVGIVLLLIAKSIRENNRSTSNVIGIIGCLAILPLILVLLAVIQKAIGYTIIAVLIIGGLVYLIGRKS
jgi:hypothetical protein